MKVTCLFFLLAATIIGITFPSSAKAQWAFQHGSFTTVPDPIPPELVCSAFCSPTSCYADFSSTGGLDVDYTTNLYWAGSGEPDYAATVTADLHVEGTSSAGSGSHSSSTAVTPIGGNPLTGTCGGGSFYSPADRLYHGTGLFGGWFNASLQVGGAGTSAHNAIAQITYSL